MRSDESFLRAKSASIVGQQTLLKNEIPKDQCWNTILSNKTHRREIYAFFLSHVPCGVQAHYSYDERRSFLLRVVPKDLPLLDAFACIMTFVWTFHWLGAEVDGEGGESIENQQHLRTEHNDHWMEILTVSDVLRTCWMLRIPCHDMEEAPFKCSTSSHFKCVSEPLINFIE